MNAPGRIVAKFVRIECDCGVHIVDFFAPEWNDMKTGFFKCNECERP